MAHLAHHGHVQPDVFDRMLHEDSLKLRIALTHLRIGQKEAQAGGS